jgi:three-Cys-motif partner protein
MAKPKDKLWKLEDHSRAKHEILKRYLGGWLPVMSWSKRLVLVDGFAGPGRYLDGEEGSPLIMLNAFLEHKRRDKITAELVFAFIEEDEARATHLTEEIDALGKLPDQVRYDVIPGNFEAVFREQLEDIQARGAELAPTFAFIDPFGYTDAPMDLTGNIMQFARCEVLIYVPLPHVHRFLGMPAQENALDSLFGTDAWRAARELTGSARRQFLHDLFREQLRAQAGIKYVRSFEIVTKSGTGGYHLFFGTGNEKGLALMKEAMWKIDPVEGRGFRDSTESDQLVLMEDKPDLAPLEQALRAHFGSEPCSIDDIELFTLTETPFLPQHVRSILKPLEKSGGLEVTKTDRKQRYTYPKGRTELRFK